MKFVLVVPPSSPIICRGYYEPLGPLYLGTMVETLCNFQVIDAYSEHADENEVFEQVKSINPDVIGFSINFSSLLNPALEIAKRIKKELDKKIVLGGNIPTFLWKKLIEKEYIDCIFLYEAEYNFKKFVEKVLNNDSDYSDIDGFVYKINGDPIFNPFKRYEENLDLFPIPDRKLLKNHEKYHKSIITSRGCPYDCIYCSSKEMWGRKWRMRTPENVFKEVKHLYENFRIKELSIVDDNFLIDKQRFAKLVEYIEKENFRISFSFSSRLECIDEKVLEMCKRINVKKIFLGLESGSNKVLKQLKRNYTQYEIFEKIDLCIKYDVLPVVSFMIGIPFEDINDVKETFYVIKKINTCFIQIHFCTPLIGTELYKMPNHYNVSIDYNKVESCSIDNEPIMNTKYFTKYEIYELYLEALALIKEKRKRWKYDFDIKQNKSKFP